MYLPTKYKERKNYLTIKLVENCLKTLADMIPLKVSSYQ